MRIASSGCSPVTSLGIQKPRSWVASCSACSLGWLALQACIVQVSPPPGRGGPRRWGDRLTRGVGGRFHARALTWGVALVRSPVRCAARGPLPLVGSGNLPQGGVVALEVRLSWHCEGRIVRLVALRLQVDTWRLWCWDRLGVIPAGVHEGIEGVVVAVVPAG